MISSLYEHQNKAIDKQNKHNKCLINMWCGTGKTRTFTTNLFIKHLKMNVIVFPSLGLINQYCNDYILSHEDIMYTEFEKYKCLAFCSDDDGKLKSKGQIQFTSSNKTLHTFLKKKDNKIILVTYQSFEKFINICVSSDIKINNLIFDEAHHIIGDKIQNIVFNNEKLDYIVDYTRFYTATPINKNGISMYNKDEPENSHCGPLAYEYLYYQAVEDKICKPFETHINLYIQKTEYKNKYQPIFESIIRECLSGKYNYWNVLTYHSFVNENDDMSENISFVKNFASPTNIKLVKQLFTRIQNEEFPHTKDIYSVENVFLKGVHSKNPNRNNIIQDFDKKVPGRIYILSSCGILNEGIDTKWANMGVPINPSKSIVKESQRIGRLVRIPEENMPPATILIPCQVDINKYSSIESEEDRDKMIREELSECGDFNTALNVISAFKYQYDSELFELCLIYPNMYAPKEVKDNLEKQGLIVLDSKGDLKDNLEYLLDKEITAELNNEKELLQNIAENEDICIEIHTQDYDEPIRYINEEAEKEEPIRLFYCEDEEYYSPVIKKEKQSKIKKRGVFPPKKRQKLFDIHTHPDLEVRWKIKESSIDLNKSFSQGILDVDVNWNEQKWYEKLEKVKQFMDENNKRPTQQSKNKDEKILGRWISQQIQNYKKKTYIMNEKEIYNAWTEFINDEKYSEYFLSNEEVWYDNLEKVEQFIDDNDKKPGHGSENQDEKKLSSWIGTQNQNYKNKTYIMKEKKIYDAWTKFINDEKYRSYLMSNEEVWYKNLEKVKLFMDDNGKRPSLTSKNQEEKILGKWLSHQITNYQKKTRIMKEKEIYDSWTKFINDVKYKEYFMSNKEVWYNNLEKVKQFMNENKTRPNKRSKNKEEKKLGSWIITQKKNYQKKTQIMKETELYDVWTEFINDEKYKEYFMSNEEIWYENLEKVKQFMDDNNKRPNKDSKNKEEKFMGTWIGNQNINYQKKINNMKDKEIYNAWISFINHEKYREYFLSNEEVWYENLEKVKQFMDDNYKRPSSISKIKEEKTLGSWIGTQNQYYKKKTFIMKEKEIYDTWTEFINDEKYSIYLNNKSTKKDMSKPEIKPKQLSQESKAEKQQRTQSELSVLHKEYKTKRSDNLNSYFKEHPEKWEEYHKISKENEESFPEDEIPRNKMIRYLENLPGKKKKVIADLGCGYAEFHQKVK